MKNLLAVENNMKFDVVVGNPPYQLQVGPKKTEPIWQKFVETSFSITKDGGYVSLIHPSGWRSSKGRFSDVSAIIKNSCIHYLSINGLESGQKTFGVGTDYDWYVCQKSEPLEKTIVSDVDGNKIIMDIRDWPFIPGAMFEQISKLIAKDNEEKVNVLYSRSAYGTDKPNMAKDNEEKVNVLRSCSYHTQREHISKSITENHKHPCVYSIGQQKGITCFYSTTRENGHFGVPKVIWTGGSGSYPIVDKSGEYGLTQFAFAIVAPLDDLENIAKAMMNPEFTKIMKYCTKDMTNDKWSRKDLATFRKDFWKDFV